MREEAIKCYQCAHKSAHLLAILQPLCSVKGYCGEGTYIKGLAFESALIELMSTYSHIIYAGTGSLMMLLVLVINR